MIDTKEHEKLPPVSKINESSDLIVQKSGVTGRLKLSKSNMVK